MINIAMCHVFYTTLETTGANKSSIKPLPTCTRTRFFVLWRTFGLPGQVNYPLVQGLASLFCNGRLVWPDQVKHPYRTAISAYFWGVWKCVPWVYCIRLGLEHIVGVEWLSLRETGADEQSNQLTAEENHDCYLLHETLLQNKLMKAVTSLL